MSTSNNDNIKAVDLGLSVKWANCNLGANSETDTGDYFAWAETTPKTSFSVGNYKWYDASTGKFNIPAVLVRGTENDAATKILGKNWKTPSDNDIGELVAQCTWTLTDNGFKVKGVNGNEIFLPFTGLYKADGLEDTERLHYWSSQYNDLPVHADDHWAWYLTSYTSSGETKPTSISSYIFEGMCIRPIYSEDTSTDKPTDPDNPGTDTPGTDNPDKPSNPDTPSTPDKPEFPDAPDDTPTVSSKALTFTDTGDKGYSVDPNVILYAGGQEIIPKTMTQKDNTLFLGNYKENDRVFSQEMLDYIKDNSDFRYIPSPLSVVNKGETGSLYMYENQLDRSSYDIASFKGGEVYRFGLVFQNRRGEWSDVVYIGDYKNTLYPTDKGTYFYAPKAEISLKTEVINKLYDMGYRKVKAVVVYPSINNRLVVCQGVLCPTVYNINSRKNNSPYAMSSWFFREIHSNKYDAYGVQNKHNFNIYNDINDYVKLSDRVQLPLGGHFGNGRKSKTKAVGSDSTFGNRGSSLSQFRAEISCASISNFYSLATDDPQNMYVDWNTLTMNTPEVDFSLNDTASSIPTENLKLRIIGVIPLTSNASDIYVNTSTPPLKQASFTGLHTTNNNHNNIDFDGSNPRLTRFDWYDYDYHQDTTDSKRTDWDVNKQNFETSDDLDLDIQQISFSSLKGVRVYKDHKVYPLYPWQGAKSLVGQYKEKDDNGMIYSALRKKVISNIRTSALTYYFPDKALSYDIGNVGLYSGDIPLVKLSQDKKDIDHAGQFNYYGETDMILSPRDYYQTYQGLLLNCDLKDYDLGTLSDVSKVVPIGKTNDPIRIKYKSSPHLVCHLNYTDDGKQELLPKFNISSFIYGDQSDNDISVEAGKYYIPGWSDRVKDSTSNSKDDSTTVTNLHQDSMNLDLPSSYLTAGFMYIGEFYKDVDIDNLPSVFGGTTPMAFEKNQWHTAGPTAELQKDGGVTIECLQGDTYYQRYDSLKTYPYSEDDPNQIVEILSFMCETRMNIDGRYDNKRGQASNLYVNRTNFNLFNPAYTQQDNFFNYYFLDPERNTDNSYPNSFMWTNSKTLGEEIDSWTNINSTSTYNLDGDKGDLYSLINWNDTLLAFQENGIARIMYNDRVQVATNDGTPIELTNSTKVSGKQYMSTTIGCKDRRTIQITPRGVYFMDGNSKDLYILGSGVDSLSKAKGFNKYFYDKDISKYRTFYDEKSTDLYFLNDESCLDYNEMLNEFEGFYDYNGTDYMFNYGDSFLSIKNNSIWKQYAGDYNMFYGEFKPFWLTLISNEGNSDKTFSNVEFESDSWNKYGKLTDDTFDHLSAWDEYQVGESVLRKTNINNQYHFSNLKRKFRIWRANIPRALKVKDVNYALEVFESASVNKETGRLLSYPESLNRIRNTWAYIRLMKYKENTNKTILHGIKVGYFD